MSKRNIPKFTSEEEEANWWYDHREETAEWMAEAFEKGETTTLAAVLERRRLKLAATPTVSIGIDTADMARARAIAEKKGLPFQTVLKELILEGLDREEQRLAS
jgi:predicted DNA binding CopG/RHH family protein